MADLFLLAGLGNPGRQYEQTRHNAGFMAVDAFSKKAGAEFKPWQGLGEYAKLSFERKELLLAKPLTYMNESGKMVSHLARFFKVKTENILICFDDLSLNLGLIRLRAGGSAGGQKGMKSVIEHFGTQNIARLRIGIGPKPERFDTSDFVLSNFAKSEQPLLQDALDKSVSALTLWLDQGLEKAMNSYN